MKSQIQVWLEERADEKRRGGQRGLAGMQEASKDWSREVCVCVGGGGLLHGDPGGSTSGGLQSFRYAPLTGALNQHAVPTQKISMRKAQVGLFLFNFLLFVSLHIVSVSLLCLEHNSSNTVCFMMLRRIYSM